MAALSTRGKERGKGSVMQREKKVYANGVELCRFELKGTIGYEVKHLCSCCPAHTLTKKVHVKGSCRKGADMAAHEIKEFAYYYGHPIYHVITNAHWVGTPEFTTTPFYEEVEEEPPCKCVGCKVTVKSEAGKTEIEIERVSL